MMSKRDVAVLIVAITGVAVALLVGLLGPRINRYMEKGTAESLALDQDPLVVAYAAMSYIKRTGATPATVSDCVSTEYSGRFNRSSKPRDYEFLDAAWPPKRDDVVLRSVFERIVLSFPERPDLLTVHDGMLVSRDSHEPVQLISIPGVDSADRPGLRFANVELWKAWSRLVQGEATGIDWLDSYEPEPPRKP